MTDWKILRSTSIDQQEREYLEKVEKKKKPRKLKKDMRAEASAGFVVNPIRPGHAEILKEGT